MLPSVSALLDAGEIAKLIERAPRPLVVAAIREAIENARREPNTAPTTEAQWCSAVTTALDALEHASLRPVLNGTGVILHTNLGRAPLADVALTAMTAVAAGYSNLEYDVETGARGSRYAHCTALLSELTGAEDALVVNNGAAALVLVLNTVAKDRECIVSRGELVEIGGSFRVPEIMASSGARLVDIGTTNRTHIDDYRGAIGPATAAIVKVHRSNFSMQGFVAEVPATGLAELAHLHQLSLIHDLGSGLLHVARSAGARGGTHGPRRGSGPVRHRDHEWRQAPRRSASRNHSWATPDDRRDSEESPDTRVSSGEADPGRARGNAHPLS